MIYEVFSIYDSKAEAYLPPFILPKVAQARRIFGDCVNSDDHQFGQNPADYTLFRLGTFNDEDGQYLLARTSENLGNGLEYVRQDDSPAMEGRSNGKEPHEGITSVPDGPSVLDGASGENSPE